MKQFSSLVIGVMALVCLAAAGPTRAADTTHLAIGTAGTTGVYYLYGGALANIISKHAGGLQATAESTGGSVENLKLLSREELDLATCAADAVNQAYYDFANSKHFKEKVEVRGLFNMYTQPIHIVALKDSDVKSVADLKGRRVGVGSPGSGTELKTRAMLSILGLEYNRDFTPEFLSFAEGSEALKDKTIDALFLSVATPAPALVSLSLTNPIKLIPLSEDEANSIEKAYPFLSKTVIPGGIYTGADEEALSMSVQSMVVARAGLSDEVVYQVVKTIFENKAELEQIHGSFKKLSFDSATPMFLPVHPGAVKYYKEQNAYHE